MSFDLINLRELEDRAQALLSQPVFDFIAGGAGDEWTMSENLRAFKRLAISPHFLGQHEEIDLSVTLLGESFSSPILICPMGAHGVVHASAEIGTATGASAEDALMTASSMSTLSLEQIAATGPTAKWFHFYMPADRGLARAILARVKTAGYKAIVFAVDIAAGSYRERDLRNDFRIDELVMGNFPSGVRLSQSLGWDDVEFLQKESGLPVVLKGVLAETIVKQAVRQGLEGIQISNHGGRGIDDSPATLTVLPRLVEAAEGKLIIIMDGGVRRGQDVFKALALGAHAVGIGRPILYALALGGAAGVQAALAQLKAELRMTMRACETAKVSAIDGSYVEQL